MRRVRVLLFISAMLAVLLLVPGRAAAQGLTASTLRVDFGVPTLPPPAPIVQGHGHGARSPLLMPAPKAASKTPAVPPTDCRMPVVTHGQHLDPKMVHRPVAGTAGVIRIVPITPCPTASHRR